jgi:hypothetical protein
MPLPAAARRCRPPVHRVDADWPRGKAVILVPRPVAAFVLAPRPTPLQPKLDRPITRPRERSVLPLPPRARSGSSTLVRAAVMRPPPASDDSDPVSLASTPATEQATATALSSSAPGRGEPRGFVPGTALLAISLPTPEMDGRPESIACAC